MSVLEFDQVDVDHIAGRDLERAVDAVPGPAGRLAELEQVVELGVQQAAAAFVNVGLALYEIRTARLYLTGAATWAGYLRDRWGMVQSQAHALEQAARCHRAIDSTGLPLPAGVSVGALRPLGPVLSAGGEQAVADAWGAIAPELDGRVTQRAVRDALERRGKVTVAPKRAYGTPLQPIEKSIERALVRARELGAKHEGSVAPASMRARAVKLAELARELAAALEGVADVTAAGARLAAIEAEPFGVGHDDDAAGDLCIGHGLRRNERGVCLGCGRADRPRAA